MSENHDEQEVKTNHKNVDVIVQRPNRNWLAIFASAAIIALLIFGSLGVAAYYMHWRNVHYLTFTDSADFDGFGRGGMRGIMTYTAADVTTDTSTTTNYIRTSGVVSAIGTDSFTLIGHGTTLTIKTNSSTVFNGASMPIKVDDSIVLLGTRDSSGAITATSVYIVRQ